MPGPEEQNLFTDVYSGTQNLARSRAIGLSPSASPVDRPAGLTVVIVNLDHPELILPALDRMDELVATFTSLGLGCEVVVADTGSTDPDVLARYDHADAWLTVQRGLEYQFSANNNHGVAAAPVGYDHVLLLNNDVVLPGPEPVLALWKAMGGDVAVAGLRLQLPDGRVQHDGVDLTPSGFRRGLPFHPGAGADPPVTPAVYPAVAVTGACLLITRSSWDLLGGLDEQYERECQDVDLCLAVRRLGHEVVVVDAGPVVHVENATRSRADGSLSDRLLFLRRWDSFCRAVPL